MNNELIERINIEIAAAKAALPYAVSVRGSFELVEARIATLEDCKAALTQQQEDYEELQHKYHLLASEMVYGGNSVQHWRQKALAYKECAGVIYELKSLLGVETPADVLEQVKTQQQEAEPVAWTEVDVDALSDFIRKIDGNNTMGAGALAEHIAEWIAAAQPQVPEGYFLLNRDESNMAIWNAIRNIKFGNRDDDKLIVAELNKLGFFVCRRSAATEES